MPLLLPASNHSAEQQNVQAKCAASDNTIAHAAPSCLHCTTALAAPVRCRSLQHLEVSAPPCKRKPTKSLTIRRTHPTQDQRNTTSRPIPTPHPTLGSTNYSLPSTIDQDCGCTNVDRLSGFDGMYRCSKYGSRMLDHSKRGLPEPPPASARTPAFTTSSTEPCALNVHCAKIHTYLNTDVRCALTCCPHGQLQNHPRQGCQRVSNTLAALFRQADHHSGCWPTPGYSNRTILSYAYSKLCIFGGASPHNNTPNTDTSQWRMDCLHTAPIPFQLAISDCRQIQGRSCTSGHAT